jgi:hypothetical protein
LDFPVVQAGANDFALSLTQMPAGGLEIGIKGRSADGTALGRRNPGSSTTSAAKSPESDTPFHVVAHLDRVQLRNGVALSPFSVDVSGIGSRPQQMILTAGLAKADDLTATIAPVDAGRRVTLNAGDAGQFLKGLFGFASMTGGRLSLTANLPSAARAKEQSNYAGTVIVRDFKVENQPFLARLFSAGSLDGMLNLMRNQGISVDRLEVPFNAKNDIIDIRDAHASGPSIGISADGYLDRRANQLALRGAIAPIYGLNGMLGAIPLLGNLLVSKKGEGIIGMTYTLSGSADEPKMSVNPLSVLTPGIFRRIFEGSVPSAPLQAESNPPKPTGTP